MQTAAIDFTSTDKMSVFAGVRKLSDAARGIVVELGTGGQVNSFVLSAPIAASPSYSFRSVGNTTTTFADVSSGYASPITNTLVGTGDIGAPRVALRVNGTEVASSSLSQGGGNYGNYPLYVGVRGGTSLWFNGRDYGICVLGRTATADEIANMEAWLNGKTKAY